MDNMEMVDIITSVLNMVRDLWIMRVGLVGSKFGVSGAGGLACMKVVEGFYRSAAEGWTIKIRQ